MDLNRVSSNIIKAAIKIHNELGPGLLESVYQSCMAVELKQMGMKVEAEKPCPVEYCGQKINDQGFRIDLLVEDGVVVELKSVEKVRNIYKKQLLT